MAVVTVAKEAGCGEDFCVALSEKLKYKYTNKEMLKYAATISGVDPNEAQVFDDETFNRVQAVLMEYIDLSIFSIKKPEKAEKQDHHFYTPYEYSNSLSGENFQKAMERVIRMLANEGNVVISGRGGNFILKGRKDLLNVRLIAPQEMRIENVKKYHNLAEDEAAAYVVKVDRNKKKYIKYYFDEDITDPLNYHIVINLGETSITKAVDMIAAFV